MSLPTMNGVARLIDDPELRFGAGSGKAVVRVRLAFNSRKKDPASNEWIDADSFFIDGKAFDQAAENIAETLTRGMEVVVSGRLKTEKWETREGEKRSGPSLLIDSIGPSLKNATAKVTKASGSGQPAVQSARQAQGRASAGDPWSSSTPGTQTSAQAGWGTAEEPPF
ncbi:single-stranded DNA-binding protein [Streptomyces sp. NPDC048479]|uniref:single-stranded DNA-binding protein n=1 Tax=Streptomyces sp. NPDC048479 TaxID=3154725 RepID=UPI0034469CE2